MLRKYQRWMGKFVDMSMYGQGYVWACKTAKTDLNVYGDEYI